MNRFFDILIRCFEFDVEVFSEPWMYYPLLIPAVCYLGFFFVKWAVLTAPIWLPIRLALAGFFLARRNK